MSFIFCLCTRSKRTIQIFLTGHCVGILYILFYIFCIILYLSKVLYCICPMSNYMILYFGVTGYTLILCCCLEINVLYMCSSWNMGESFLPKSGRGCLWLTHRQYQPLTVGS